MASSRWTPTPTGVRRATTGPSRAASFAAGLLTIIGTTVALVIAAVILFPSAYGGGSGDSAIAAASPTAAATPGASGPIVSAASPAPLSAASPAPAASVPPATTPAPTEGVPASVAPALVQMRETAPLTVRGREVGRVTVQAVREVRDTTTTVVEGQRLMVASVRVDAGAARLPYDELHWRIEDDNGDRWEPVAAAAPKPLGSGTLAPEAGRAGGVAFVIPDGVRVRAVVLTDGSGADLVVFDRPTVTG